jgi:hypothetical protein
MVFSPIAINSFLGWHNCYWGIFTQNNSTNSVSSNYIIQTWTNALSTSINLPGCLKIELSTSNMIQTFCPFNCPKSFKIKAKQLTYSYNCRCTSWTSSLVIVRPIYNSQVSTIIYTLGVMTKYPHYLRLRMMIVITTWKVEHPWNVEAPLHHKIPSQHPNLFVGMQNDPIITKDLTPLHWHKCPNVGATTKTRKGVDGEN